MKSVMIDADWFDKPTPYLMLENLHDLHLYAEKTDEEAAASFGRILRNNVPNDKINHLLCKTHGDNVVLTASIMGNFTGDSLVESIGKVSGEKYANMTKHILNGETIIINPLGGYCFLSDDMTVTDEKEYVDIVDKTTYKIADNASYLNLENDAELEKTVIDFFDKHGAEQSYVLNLRNFDIGDLTKIFNEFAENGGHTVYVYTTGMDVDQMYDYSKALIRSNIDEILFDFNSGINDDINKVVAFLQEQDVGVTIAR